MTTKNKKRGYVSIVLDKERDLCYKFNSFVQLEDELGKPLAELGNSNGVKMSDLRAMLWAGLIHEDNNLTVEDAGDLIDEAESIEYVTTKISEAMDLAMGNGLGKQAKGKTKKAE